MSDLIPYGEHFEKIIDIIESAKERAYRKANEELVLMYRNTGEYISIQRKWGCRTKIVLQPFF